RGELDALQDLVNFAGKLESASLDTMRNGIMTADLTGLVEKDFKAQSVNSWEFIDEIKERLT
ncbi:MAG: NADP-dependent isocitrate dehydrogenase, partial [Oscillospiraceae bacterium]|nr:NADP-dependent isocitrate dehydrogenase [Oscillospiraceae bacterium]